MVREKIDTEFLSHLSTYQLAHQLIVTREGFVVIPQVANRAFEVQASTNLLSSNSWPVLNLPANAPFFPSSNRTAIVEEALSPGSPRYYRARVFEP